MIDEATEWHMSGTLALVGAGEYLPGVETIDRWLFERLPDAPRVVCLPTGAGQEGAERIGYWSRLGVDHFTRLGATVQAVEVVDRATAQDERLADLVRGANFVYLSGGRPAYLLETLADTPILDAILGVLDGGGIVAGCSAGAMIWGEQVRSLRFEAWLPGFNRLRGAALIPHFDEIPQAMIDAAWSSRPAGLSFIGVDRDTALALTADGAQVVGQGSVSVWHDHARTRHRHGDPVQWP
jgi:cyanophycinase